MLLFNDLLNTCQTLDYAVVIVCAAAVGFSVPEQFPETEICQRASRKPAGMAFITANHSFRTPDVAVYPDTLRHHLLDHLFDIRGNSAENNHPIEDSLAKYA